METYLELPFQQARDWIAGAARECGYTENLADALGYNAWWLENRGVDGISLACRYLIYIHRKYRTKPDFGNYETTIRDQCPIYCGISVGFRFETEYEDQLNWTTTISTNTPMLMGPTITRYCEDSYIVQLEYDDKNAILSDYGINIKQHAKATIEPTSSVAAFETRVRLIKKNTDGARFDRPYERKETLPVPMSRFIDGGGFRFD